MTPNSSFWTVCAQNHQLALITDGLCSTRRMHASDGFRAFCLGCMSAHAAIVDGRAENDDESVTSPLSAQLLERRGGGGSEKQKHAERNRRRPRTAESTQNTPGAAYWQKKGLDNIEVSPWAPSTPPGFTSQNVLFSPEKVPAVHPRTLKPRCSPSPPTWTTLRRYWICWSARCAWSAWTPRPRCCRASTPSAAVAWRTSSAPGTNSAARSAASWWTAGWTTCRPTSFWFASWTGSSSGRSEGAQEEEEVAGSL